MEAPFPRLQWLLSFLNPEDEVFTSEAGMQSECKPLPWLFLAAQTGKPLGPFFKVFTLMGKHKIIMNTGKCVTKFLLRASQVLLVPFTGLVPCERSVFALILSVEDSLFPSAFLCVFHPESLCGHFMPHATKTLYSSLKLQCGRNNGNESCFM